MLSGSLSVEARKLRPCLALLLVRYTSAVLLNTLPPNSARHSQLASIFPHVRLLLKPRVKFGLALPATIRSASLGFLVKPLTQSGDFWVHRKSCCPGAQIVSARAGMVSRAGMVTM